MKRAVRFAHVLYLIAGLYLFDWKGVALIVGASFLGWLYRDLSIEIEEPEPERESCAGCKNDLGGGHCRINVEGECREGGGFELWEPKDGRNDE